MKTYCQKGDVFKAVTFDGTNIEAISELLEGTLYTVMAHGTDTYTGYYVEYRGSKEFALFPGVIVARSLYGTVTKRMHGSTDTWVEVKA